MLLLAIFVLTLLLVAFTYQIITTPVTPVDAPTLVKAAAASAAAVSAPPAPALPARGRQAPAFPGRGGRPGRTSEAAGRYGEAAGAFTRPAPRTSPRRASGRARTGGVTALAIVGLAAGVIGGWLLLRPARGAFACSHQAFQVCSQGFVVLTGSQLSGGTIALVGFLFVIIAGVIALR